MSKPHFMKKGLAALLAFSVVASAGGSALAAGVPAADAVGGEGVYQSAPDTTVQQAVPSVAVTAPESGLRFNAADKEYVQVQGAIEIPNTVEVWLKLDQNENRRQIIMNNYGRGGTTWGIEVTANNTLRYWDQAGPNHDYKFNDIKICTGDWMLISVVRDQKANELRVYVDGELKNTTSVSGFGDATLNSWLCFGSDYHTDPLLLDGEIAEVRMWDDVRTADEIAEYAGKTVNGTEAGLAHAWNFQNVEDPVYRDQVFKDLVSGGVDVRAVGYAENPNARYTVSFDLGIADGVSDPVPAQEILTGGKVDEPTAQPTLEGFEFTGWYKDASCTQKWDFASDTVTDHTTLYAGWKYTYQSAGFEDMTGVSFDDPGDQLAMEERLSDVPLSFEATVKLPKDLEGRGGVIVGNYMDAGYYDYDLGYVNFEVYDNGAPRLYWSQERRNQPGGDTQSVMFSGVDLRQDDWVHVAITFDPAEDTAKCYINGVLVSTVDNFQFNPVIPAQALKVGGDYRGTGGQVIDSGYNEQYFKGEIANVSVWSTVRTDEQIAADVAALRESAANVPQAQDGLLGSWSFADANADLYKDLSASGNDVAYFVDWIDPDFAEGDYSMVALPDTQFLSQDYPDIYKKLTRWITVNKEEYNIQAVMHMGDMVNSNYTNQWTAAKDAMAILDEKDIPWMPMRGNHDDSNGFNNTFPYEEFENREYFGGSYEEKKLDSNYWEFSVGDREYLVLSMGYAPSSDAISWAEEIIKENPEKNVILTAHSLMYWDGTHHDPSDLDSPAADSSGQQLWDRLGAKYPNVVLAMGGHIGFPDIIARTDKNGAGKDVTSLLCDAQGIDGTYGLGMMALLTFHEDSNEVDVNWYSAEEGKLFRTRNQFTIEVPHVGENTVTAVDTQDAVTAYVGTAQDELGLPETVGVTLSDGSRITLPVTWTCADYDADSAGTYTFTGTLGSAEGVSNPDGLTAQITVTLQNRSTGGGSSSGGSGSSSSNRPDASVSGTGGSVSASSNGTVTITPDDGYEISKITVNGEEVDIPADGRLTGLDKNDEVVVTFAKITEEQPEQPGGGEEPFADVADDAWYADAVQYVYENGMMNGTDDTAFSPDANTTRAMIVTMLYRMEEQPAAQGSSFADVAAGSYYADAVAWAAENGIVNGISETSFAPDNSIPREQLAAILYRYAQYKGYDVSAENSLGAYTDTSQISSYAADAMQWANGEGLITGVTSTTLDPQGIATRAQVAAILMRFCEGIAG